MSEADIDAAAALNDGAVPHVNAIGRDVWRHFIADCARCDLAEMGSVPDRLPSMSLTPAALIVAMAPDTEYNSDNFLWFRARYQSFLYIDRAVVARRLQGRGIGRRMYEDVIHGASGRFPLITCEVNIDPPNPGSMAFHLALGFAEVGQQTTGAGKRVSLLARPLV